MKVWITRDIECCYDWMWVKVWRWKPSQQNLYKGCWQHGDGPLFKLKIMAFEEEFGFCPEHNTIEEKELSFK